MRCPSCLHDCTQVKDSRPIEANSVIWRRRFCPACGSRFTTFERVRNVTQCKECKSSGKMKGKESEQRNPS